MFAAILDTPIVFACLAFAKYVLFRVKLHVSVFNTIKSIFLGEVIGFVKDPKNENKQVICKLDYRLASESILKGVVTRSQYLEARLPEKGGK